MSDYSNPFETKPIEKVKNEVHSIIIIYYSQSFFFVSKVMLFYLFFTYHMYILSYLFFIFRMLSRTLCLKTE